MEKELGHDVSQKGRASQGNCMSNSVGMRGNFCLDRREDIDALYDAAKHRGYVKIRMIKHE